MSTASASNLVPDVLFARASFLRDRESDMILFSRVWLESIDRLTSNPESWLPALGKAFQQSPAQTRDVMSKIKLPRFADNREFFGLEKRSAQYLSLFDDASRVWQKEGVITAPADAASTRWLDALEALSKEHVGEVPAKDIEFQPGSQPEPTTTPVIGKRLSIYFETGTYRLDATGRKLVAEYASTLQQLANTYVQVEGNTDSTGGPGTHIPLSKARAQAVVDYLVEQHGFDRARFQVVGNGMDRPLGDNRTEDGRALNRRTDFWLFEHAAAH